MKVFFINGRKKNKKADEAQSTMGSLEIIIFDAKNKFAWSLLPKEVSFRIVLQTVNNISFT